MARPKGAKDKKRRTTAARKLAAQAEATGTTPLAIILTVANHFFEKSRDPVTGKIIDEAAAEKATDHAAKAAPYVHPRQAAIEHTGNVNVTHEGALKALE